MNFRNFQKFKNDFGLKKIKINYIHTFFIWKLFIYLLNCLFLHKKFISLQANEARMTHWIDTFTLKRWYCGSFPDRRWKLVLQQAKRYWRPICIFFIKRLYDKNLSGSTSQRSVSHQKQWVLKKKPREKNNIVAD